MAAVKKKQPELPGAERETISLLDEVLAPLLDAREEAKQLRESVKSMRDAATERMKGIASSLERDEHGNPCYVFRDGERAIAIKLVTSTRLVFESLGDNNADVDQDIG